MSHPIQCSTCKHYSGDMKCEAFKKIPIKIWTGKVDHRKSVDGDGGIQFEKITEEEYG